MAQRKSRVTDDQVEEARNTRVSDVVGRYVPDMERNGHEWVALCPFHQEKTPSFHAVDNKGFYHCFGCGANGDVIDFVQEWRRCSFVDAVLEITNRDSVVPIDTARAKTTASRRERPQKETWEPIVPPEEQLRDDIRHFKFGRPSAVYRYHDRDGGLLYAVCRFDGVDHKGNAKPGAKQFQPLTYGNLSREGKDGRVGWHFRQIPHERPLYGLDRLPDRDHRAVLLVEGEKTADAVQSVWSKNAVVSWPNGTQAIDRARWSDLTGMTVVICLDVDLPGLKATFGHYKPNGVWNPGVIEHLREAGAKEVKVVDLTAEIAEVEAGARDKGWDLANAVQDEGWDGQAVWQWLKNRIKPAAEAERPQALLDWERENVRQKAPAQASTGGDQASGDAPGGDEPPPDDAPPPLDEGDYGLSDQVLAETGDHDAPRPPGYHPKDYSNGSEVLTEANGDLSTGRAGDDRPDITVAGGALPEIVDAAEAAMLDRGPPIFQRGALLVRVLRTVGGDSAGVRREAGTPVIRQVDATWLREQLTRVARFRKWDARMEDYKSVDCPKEVSETLLARCGTWRARPLRTIVQAPTPRPDGSVIEREGYDGETALLFDANGVQFPSVPERPSKADAVTALNRLLRPLDEFPFANRQDETVAVSAVLTALARPSLRTAPMHVFSAPAAGSGKSMLADYAALVSTGRPAAVVTHGRTDEEAEKRIGAVLLQGDQVVNLDNVERPLSGELLCQLLTQETIKVRKLGVSEMIDAPSVATFLATGNNLTVIGDLVRRVVMCALDPNDERPEHRRFNRDFYAYVRENRGQLVADALTVLKAFKVAGCPDQHLQPMGGFADWSAWIRNALVWLDLVDPCLTTERLRETDPSVGNLRAVVTAWLETFGEHPITVRQAIDRATFTVNGQLTNESLHEALSAVAGDKGGINARRLGHWLRKHDGRVIDGFRIERDGDDGHGIVCWKATRVPSEGDSHPGFRVHPGFPQYPVRNCQDSDSDSYAGTGETNPDKPVNPDADHKHNGGGTDIASRGWQEAGRRSS